VSPLRRKREFRQIGPNQRAERGLSGVGCLKKVGGVGGRHDSKVHYEEEGGALLAAN